MINGHLHSLQQILDTNVFTLIERIIDEFQKSNCSFNEWIIINDSVKAIYLNSSGADPGIMEYHEIFTDIHITLKGTDTIYFANHADSVIAEYDSGKDYAIVSASASEIINNLAQNFVLLSPKEIHTNLLAPGSSKVVIKLKQNA